MDQSSDLFEYCCAECQRWAKLVKAWLAKHQDEIEVFYLPSYSPELNPDEMLNADLKQAVTTKAPARTKGQLLKVTTSHMRKLRKSPERVIQFLIQ